MPNQFRGSWWPKVSAGWDAVFWGWATSSAFPGPFRRRRTRSNQTVPSIEGDWQAGKWMLLNYNSLDAYCRLF